MEGLGEFLSNSSYMSALMEIVSDIFFLDYLTSDTFFLDYFNSPYCSMVPEVVSSRVLFITLLFHQPIINKVHIISSITLYARDIKQASVVNKPGNKLGARIQYSSNSHEHVFCT